MKKLFLSLCIAFFSFNVNATELSYYQSKTIKAFINSPQSSKNEYFELIYARGDNIRRTIMQNAILAISEETQKCTKKDIFHTTLCEMTLKEIEEIVDETIKEELSK